MMITKALPKDKEQVHALWKEAFSFDVYEGDIGQFYSIYGKVVMAIRQSREDERKEKMFLQDLIADISHQLNKLQKDINIFL